MKNNKVKDILAKLSSGKLSIQEAEKQVESYFFSDLGFANVDHHRSKRQGFPEVIFGQNKTIEQIVSIAENILTDAGVTIYGHYNSIKGNFIT